MNIHIKHVGIQGNAKHSPKSLHTEGRAIDIKSLTMFFSEQFFVEFSFENSMTNKFFNTFRSCWGRTIANQNDCPLFSGETGLTASVGKEDLNHQKHLHISVPHCIKGKYSNFYFQR